MLRGLFQVHFIDEDWQSIAICYEAFHDGCICTIHCFCRPVLLKQSSLSASGCSVRCDHWFLENCTVPVIYVMISWFIFFWTVQFFWFYITAIHLEKCRFYLNSFLGDLEEFWKATVSFVMSVRLLVHPHGKTWLPLDEFLWMLLFEEFSKIWPENSSLIKIWQECWLLYLEFWEWKMFLTGVVEKIKTRILCSVTFFQKLYHLWGNVEKYG